MTNRRRAAARRFIAGLAIAATCATATAQLDAWDTGGRLASMLGLNWWGAAEGMYADLVATQQRDERGVLMADVYLNFSNLISCDIDRYGSRIPGSDSKPQNSPQCQQTQQQRLATWDARYPGSTLAALARYAVQVYLARQLPATDPAANEKREQHLAAALKALEGISPANRTPSWYIARMELATLSGWGKKRFWPILEEAAEKYPAHAAIYEAATIHFLPRNGGSLEEVDEVAVFAAGKSRADYGEAMYAWVYETLTYGRGFAGRLAFDTSAVSWPQMRAGLLDLNKRHPTAWTHNRMAQYACDVRDMPLLTRLIADKEASQENGWTQGAQARCRKLVADTQEKV